ncbi:MAG: type II toxin-antitoxin system VapC family toxin [Burkholderiaceae bacterium]
MNLLLDTHLLIWAASSPRKLSRSARQMIADDRNLLHFSVASLWEIVIKSTLQRPDFSVEAGLLRRGLLDNGYVECEIEGPHALAVASLPPIHRDPFDRLLVAQAMVNGWVLLTADLTVADYGSPVRLVD